MSDGAIQKLRQYRGDLATCAADCYKIRDKTGSLRQLELNAVQKYVHDKLEAQKAEKGWVRALILKGRRPGISTYVAARYYHNASMHSGVNVYILAHEQAASDTLFGIVDRYQKNNPIRPSIGTSNAKELVFDRLDSSYSVATAGQKAGGRSKTTQLFHGSEVAFWANATDHFASSVQTVSLMPGTEVILESTANGPSGEFYGRWQDAEKGVGDYIPIFVPWFADPDNTREPERGFELSSEADDGEISEIEYQEMYDLSMGQMAWRRAKIQELRSPELFRQEYPADAAEAWVTPGHDSFLKPAKVLRARKRKTEGYGPLILGVDPASMGGDRFAIAARRGLRVEWVRTRSKLDTQEGIAWVRSVIDEVNPARVNIDAGNVGHAIVTGLRSIGHQYAKVIRGVNFGGTSQFKLATPKLPGPKNRRAEMYCRFRDWLDDPMGPAIPDRDSLHSDLIAPKLKPQLNNDTLLESKEDMRKRGVRSTDEGDSVVLTFAQSEVITDYAEAPQPQTFGATDRPKPKLHITEGPLSWMG